MATVHFATTAANAILSKIVDALDAGTANAVLELYTGTMPATPETAVTTQVKLGTLTLSKPCGSVANKTLTFAAITADSAADANGTAVWGRFAVDGVGVIDCDVSVTGGTGAIKMNTTTVYADGPISATTATISIS